VRSLSKPRDYRQPPWLQGALSGYKSPRTTTESTTEHSASQPPVLHRQRGSNAIYLVPQLCVTHPFPLQLLESARWLPCVLFHIEGLLLAEELKASIQDTTISDPSATLLFIMATTAPAVDAACNYELLETLGDSLLKVLVSAQLFQAYPKKAEGDLTRLRSDLICNSNLFRLAKDKGLERYLRTLRYNSLTWRPPGMAHADAPPIPFPATDDDHWLNGKRDIADKSIADCVEALIAACYLTGGTPSALQFAAWLGVEVDRCADLPALMRQSIPKAECHDTDEGTRAFLFFATLPTKSCRCSTTGIAIREAFGPHLHQQEVAARGTHPRIAVQRHNTLLPTPGISRRRCS